MSIVGTPHFWEDEEGSPILARNFKFITRENIANMIDRVRGWKDLVDQSVMGEVVNRENRGERTNDKELLRIFQRDAERTYVSRTEHGEAAERTKHRQDTHVDILRRVCLEICDYHQGVGYIAAFLELFLDEEETSDLILSLHKSDKYCKGYFLARPERFVADGRVLNNILLTRNPVLHAHLAGKGVLPEMFASKWFIGLCLHVLPYSALFDFYELFLTHGVEYLFKFALSYIETFEPELLAAKGTSQVMTILRAEDPKCDWKPPQEMIKRHMSSDIFGKIVHSALEIDLDVDLEQLRAQEMEILAEQIRIADERVRQMKEEEGDDEIVFSDEDDDDK